jgi:dTDP-4-dehydrorhamnose reductase
MKVAVIGADGQLGNDVCAVFSEKGHQVIPLVWKQMDISDRAAVSKTMGEIEPELIINTAAMHHVDQCELDPEKAFRVNGIGSQNLARFAVDGGSILMHVSTDYVFSGEKGTPYLEEDCPRPLNAYGNTKLAGEYFIRAIAEKHYVIRLSGLYGTHPCLAKGLNFVDLMLKLAGERKEIRVVDDEVLTPTFTEEAARQMSFMIENRAVYGLYHATAEGSCSWYEFAREIFSLTGTRVNLNAALPGEFPQKVPRPKYSVLENGRLKSQGLNVMGNWKEGLGRYLKRKLEA